MDVKSTSGRQRQNLKSLSFILMANYRVELPGYYSSVELKPISEMFQQCAQSDKARQELLGRSAGYLFHSIIDALNADLLNLVRKIVGNIEDHIHTEDRVALSNQHRATEILIMPDLISKGRRVVLPSRY
jgi:magnesium transporter